MQVSPLRLLQQADSLLAQKAVGQSGQTDRRRAVSAAYYAVFHTLLAALADEFAGARFQTSERYRLIYRSLAHERAKRVCREVTKPTPSKPYEPYWPNGGFSSLSKGFATAYSELIEARYLADYDPHHVLTLSDATALVKKARLAILRLARVKPSHRKLFLTFMLCEPRN